MFPFFTDQTLGRCTAARPLCGLRWVLWAGLLISGLPTVAQQLIHASLRGVILQEDSIPANGAHIRLLELNREALCSPDGTFLIENITPGTYLLEVEMPGHRKHIQKVEVSSAIAGPVRIRLKATVTQLNEVVVTGQFEPQSLKNSVYQVRTIDRERIRLRGATNLQTVLSTELGVAFSNDLTLGTSDIQLMGMPGQNVKILLDGIPMVDRGSTRESIGQVDINSIERIEIVEGPMSVVYGTDALAGVINIITKKTTTETSHLTVVARLQEETVGKEYKGVNGKGVHNQSVGLSWQKKRIQLEGNVTRNQFGGWQGVSTGRAKAWLPKDQLLYAATMRYSHKRGSVWYRFNGTDETIRQLGNVSAANAAGDKEYTTFRWFHQVQGEFRQNDKLTFTGALSYTDYSRKTLSTTIDFTTGKRTLSLDEGAQDKSIFKTAFFRGAAHYKLTQKFVLLAGVDFSENRSSGQRILGSPSIMEYALFLSPELRLLPGLKLSPGLRFLNNSVYDAPPVIPSFNGKVSLSKHLDLRVGYARGFRSPALRELYFNFYDASHSIHGNENLKAEYSNSFNSFLVWQAIQGSGVKMSSTLGAFYNQFHDLIDTAVDPEDNSQTTYLNINLFKTKGLTVDNKLFWKNSQLTLGASYIARYNRLSESSDELGATPRFTWSPEINSNFLYTFSKAGASLNFFYKFTGKRPAYQTVTSSSGTVSARLAETSGFHMADLTIDKSLGKMVRLMGGVRNLFNVTNLSNSAQDTGSAHSSAGAVPMSYGRSYFLGLHVQWSKIN